jgi:hypothetical protein
LLNLINGQFFAIYRRLSGKRENLSCPGEDSKCSSKYLKQQVVVGAPLPKLIFFNISWSPIDLKQTNSLLMLATLPSHGYAQSLFGTFDSTMTKQDLACFYEL